MTATKVSDVFGGWNSGYAVDVTYEITLPHGRETETRRVHLDRDRLILDGGGYDESYIASAVADLEDMQMEDLPRF